MIMPKPVRPPPVMPPRSLWVKPNCVPQSLKMPPRTEKPTPAARMAMKPAKSRRFAFDAIPSVGADIMDDELWWGWSGVGKKGSKRPRRQLHNLAAGEGGLMRAETDAGPVG